MTTTPHPPLPAVIELAPRAFLRIKHRDWLGGEYGEPLAAFAARYAARYGAPPPAPVYRVRQVWYAKVGDE
jgi:hypothetical protein